MVNEHSGSRYDGDELSSPTNCRSPIVAGCRPKEKSSTVSLDTHNMVATFKGGRSCLNNNNNNNGNSRVKSSKSVGHSQYPFFDALPDDLVPIL